MDFNITDYLDPKLIPIALALAALGYAIKRSKLRDELIPWLLIPAGIILTGLWLCAQAIPTDLQMVLATIVDAIVQGSLCAALAVFGNQLHKQTDAIAQAKREQEGIIGQADKEV